MRPSPPRVAVLLLSVTVLISACEPSPPPRQPSEVRAEIVRLLPARTTDREGWARDIQTAFATLEIEPSTSNICATLAVTEQESTFSADPPVPGLGKIALEEIERRAQQRNVPRFIVRGALTFESPNGKRYDERLAAVRTEQQLSELYEDFISTVPMGKRLFSGANPVHTGGPMQVSVDFAQEHAKAHPYPYPMQGSLRHEVFTRRGGMYFGIAHLLGYPAPYAQPLYRFADFNAGFYASRNAAFQQAVSLASGMPLQLDGDLVSYSGKARDKVGATEQAVRVLARQLELDDKQVRRALQQGNSGKFERSDLYKRVFALAEELEHRPLPRAVMPRIALKSPKITRKLTTEWFATRVNQRYLRCMARIRG